MYYKLYIQSKVTQFYRHFNNRLLLGLLQIPFQILPSFFMFVLFVLVLIINTSICQVVTGK